jgi:hypothetical protein
LKVAIHKHDKVLDEKIEDFKGRVGVLDSNNDALRAQNGKMESYLASAGSAPEVSAHNIEESVYPTNAISSKLLDL